MSRWLAGPGPLLLAVALLALLPLLPRPEWPWPTYRYLVVVDLTQSMNVTDAAPESERTRMAHARVALDAVLTALPCGAEVGLGLFSGHRSLLLFSPVEVCAQRRELRTMVAGIDWRMAWTARSEVAKGLHDAIRVAAELGGETRLVFVTDGHEAPPLHPVYRPRFRGKPGAIRGLIVGVGGLRPVPIPKLDRNGEQIGVWSADEVQQVDSYSFGRAGTNVAGEAMVGVDGGDLEARIRAGTEHLSQLRETHLEQLAAETGLYYHRLRHPAALVERLQARDLSVTRLQALDLRWLPAVLTLLLVLAGHLPRPGLSRPGLSRPGLSRPGLSRLGRNQATP